MSIDDSEIGRGRRCREIRKLAKLSSTALAKKLNLSRTIVSLWENGHNGIPPKGARQVVDLMNLLGIKCSINWLWFGTGSPPFKPEGNFTSSEEHNDLSDPDPRAEEIIAFQSLGENSVTIELKNSSMFPFYKPGDIVGGYWETNPAINENYINCIIELNNKIQVRRIKKTGDTYSLSFFSVCNNETEPFTIEKISIDKIAIIKRLWSL
jgi:transcriptional regulator with XRE-family HTH domain